MNTISSKLAGTAVGVILLVVSVGCSSTKKVATTSTTAGAAAAATTSPTSSGPASTAATTVPPTTAATSGVSGTWTGQYSGSFSGTFSLTWQQTGTTLSGTIKISGFNDVATPINGSLQGANIKFGTVGTQEVTYTGSVSGSSMSGTWDIQAAGRSLGKGAWSATKSS